MASNKDNDEKPNLRPTKRVNAGGKSIFLHRNLNHPHGQSYIHAVWSNTDNKSSEREDPFGIEQPNVEYSLNKQQRWKILENFRHNLINESSSSEEDELDTQSDSEQRRKKKSINRNGPNRRVNLDDSKTKYRLQEYHDLRRKANCISITTNTGEQRIRTPRQTYMRDTQVNEQNPNDNEEMNPNADITYYATIPVPKEKQLAKVRKQRSTKAKSTIISIQRSKYEQVKENLEQIENSTDDEGGLSNDDNQPKTPIDALEKPSNLRLNDFLPIAPKIDDADQTKSVTENLVTINKFEPKSSIIYVDKNEFFNTSKKFHRQMSREEKLYNRDKAIYLQTKKQRSEKSQTVNKSPNHLMSLSFRSISIHKADLTIDYLTEKYGKDFIHAQCYPETYLICLTDRLKSAQWSNHFELFPSYSKLDAYLIIILNDEKPNDSEFSRVKIGLNMDLFCDTIQIESLFESTYRLNDVIEKSIGFITTLPFDCFKPIDYELSQKKIFKNDDESDMSESEFINRQIRHIHLLDRKPAQSKDILNDEKLNIDVSFDEYDIIKPEICTSCYQEVDDNIPMTALKSCAHWLCNNCWKQYIENSIKAVKIVHCPEWNCCSIVDVGTIISLVNVRCMNIYERNIEKCLVNVSRSYVKCPAKSCANIVQVIGDGVEYIRCRCGHEFCIHCKQEAHFPATCNAYRLYIDEVYRNGDMISEYNAITEIKGRNCISCNNFIEKNGGCNHMTCRCGTEFCWVCAAYWKDHIAPDGQFRCPSEAIPLKEEVLAKHHAQSRRFYFNAIQHRHERVLQNHSKKYENATRLLSTIPLDKNALFNQQLVKEQIDNRQSILRHLHEMIKYIIRLHRICEFIAVSAEGYGNNPSEFRNSLLTLEIIAFNMCQVLEGGRGSKAIEQLKQLHANSEKVLERLRRAVRLRELNRKTTTGYVTS